MHGFDSRTRCTSCLKFIDYLRYLLFGYPFCAFGWRRIPQSRRAAGSARPRKHVWMKHEDVFERHGFNKRLNHVASVIVNATQDHFRATIARRSAVTSRPSLLKVSIRAFESSRSRNILTGEPLLPAGAKNTRIFRRLFAASGRGDTKATRSMLRTVPLGKQTNFSFMSDCKACDFIRATRILNHLILSDRASPRVWPNWCVLVKR